MAGLQRPPLLLCSSAAPTRASATVKVDVEADDVAAGIVHVYVYVHVGDGGDRMGESLLQELPHVHAMAHHGETCDDMGSQQVVVGLVRRQRGE